MFMSVIKCADGHEHEVSIHPGARVRPIGTAREAVAAVDRNLQYIGCGIAKDVYASRDGKRVYKVPNSQDRCWEHDDCEDWEWDTQQLDIEFEIANGTYDRRGRRAFLAPTSAFVVDGVMVLCQPKYTMVGDLPWEQQERLMDRAYLYEQQVGVADMHSENCGVTRNGRVVLFDLGA